MLSTRQLDDIDRHGYTVVRAVAPLEQVERLRCHLESAFVTRPDGRLVNAWAFDAQVRALATAAGPLACAGDVLGGPAVAFQTLNFRMGTSQAPHSDAIHFDTVPSGGVCAIWVALEDVGPDQGPVEVYPGSHRWPRESPQTLGMDPARFQPCEYERLVRDRLESEGCAPVPVAMRAGDALIWSGNLVHGGGERGPDSTRWSQVTHFVRRGSVLVTPQRSEVESGRYDVRVVVDAATGKVVPPGPDAPVVRHSAGSRLSWVGGARPTGPVAVVSRLVGRWRRCRAKIAIARIRFRRTVPV